MDIEKDSKFIKILSMEDLERLEAQLSEDSSQDGLQPLVHAPKQGMSREKMSECVKHLDDKTLSISADAAREALVNLADREIDRTGSLEHLGFHEQNLWMDALINEMTLRALEKDGEED